MVHQAPSTKDHESSPDNSSDNSSTNETKDSYYKTSDSSTSEYEEVEIRNIKKDHQPTNDVPSSKSSLLRNKNSSKLKFNIDGKKDASGKKKPNTNKSLFRSNLVNKFRTKKELKNYASSDNIYSITSSKSESLADVKIRQLSAGAKMNSKHTQQNNSVRGLFKLWSKKTNGEDDVKSITGLNTKKKSKTQIQDIKKSPDMKKKKCRFTFFKKKCKEKEVEPIKETIIENVSAKSEVNEIDSNISEEITEWAKSSVIKKIESEVEGFVDSTSWVSKFKQNYLESNDKVHIRWCNTKYIKRSNTVLDLMRSIYNDTETLFGSKSLVSIKKDSHVKSYKVIPNKKFAYQSVAAFVMHTTITNKKHQPVSLYSLNIHKKTNKSRTRIRIEPKLTLYGNPKLLTPKSSKMIQVCHCTARSNYASQFAEMSNNSVDLQDNYSDERVFKIVEYENAEPKVIDSDLIENQDMTTSMIDFDNMVIIAKQVKSPNDKKLVQKKDMVVQCNSCSPLGADKAIMTDVKKEICPPISQNNKKRCKLAEMYMRGYWASMNTSCSSCCNSVTSLDFETDVVFNNMSVKRSSRIEVSGFKSVEKMITETLKKMVVKSLASKYSNYMPAAHTHSSEIRKRFDLLKKLHVMHFAEKFLSFIRGIVENDEVPLNPSKLRFKKREKNPAEGEKRETRSKSAKHATPKGIAHKQVNMLNRYPPRYISGVAAKSIKPIPSTTSLTKMASLKKNDRVAKVNYYNSEIHKSKESAKAKRFRIRDETSYVKSNTEIRNKCRTEHCPTIRECINDSFYPFSFSCPSFKRMLNKDTSHDRANKHKNRREFDFLPLNDKKIILVSSNFSIDVISPVNSIMKLMENRHIAPDEKKRKRSSKRRENVLTKNIRLQKNVETQFSTTDTIENNNISTQTFAFNPRQKNQRNIWRGKIKKFLKHKNESMSPIVSSSRCTNTSINTKKNMLKNYKIRSQSLLEIYQRNGLQGLLHFFGLTKKYKNNKSADAVSIDSNLPTTSTSGQSWDINLDVPPTVLRSRSVNFIPSRKSKDFHLNTTNMSIAIQSPIDFTKIHSRKQSKRLLNIESDNYIHHRSDTNFLKKINQHTPASHSKSRNPKYWTGICSQKSLINNVIKYSSTRGAASPPTNLYLASYSNSWSGMTTDEDDDDSNLKVIRLNSNELMIISAIEESTCQEPKENKMYLKVGNKNGKFFVERRERLTKEGGMSIMEITKKIPQSMKTKKRKRKILVRNCKVKTDLSHHENSQENLVLNSIKLDKSFQYVKDTDNLEMNSKSTDGKKTSSSIEESNMTIIILKEDKAIQKSTNVNNSYHCIPNIKLSAKDVNKDNTKPTSSRKQKIYKSCNEISCGSSCLNYKNIIEDFYRDIETPSQMVCTNSKQTGTSSIDNSEATENLNNKQENKSTGANQRECAENTSESDDERAKKIIVYLKFDTTIDGETNTTPCTSDLKGNTSNAHKSYVITNKDNIVLRLTRKTSSQFDLPVKDKTDNPHHDMIDKLKGINNKDSTHDTSLNNGEQQSWIKSQIITCDFAYEQLKAAKKNKNKNKTFEKINVADNTNKAIPKMQNISVRAPTRHPKKSCKHIYQNRNFCVNNLSSKRCSGSPAQTANDEFVFLIDDHDWINNVDKELHERCLSNDYSASAELLKSHEAKEAVLQIYSEKIVCGGKHKFVARVPQFERDLTKMTRNSNKDSL